MGNWSSEEALHAYEATIHRDKPTDEVQHGEGWADDRFGRCCPENEDVVTTVTNGEDSLSVEPRRTL